MSIEEKRARAKRMGIPMPITQMSEGVSTSVPVTAANQDKHSRLAALKSGANRQKVQNLVKSKGSATQGGFEGLPEPTMKKNPNHPGNKLSDPSKAVQVQQNFGGGAQNSSEFNAMEAMYGGGNDTAAYSPQPALAQQSNVNIQTSQPELSIPTQAAGPVFDPVAMLQQKRMQEQHVPQEQQSSKYLQYAVNPQTPTTPQGQFDFQNMQKMMEEIAKQTISEVLSEYTEKSKSKLTYENVKTKGDTKVIKTQDGKYYKLTPVALTKN
jgi:hypothetical protein